MVVLLIKLFHVNLYNNNFESVRISYTPKKMKELSESEIKQKLKAAFWDTNISENELYLIFSGNNNEKKYHIDKNHIYSRLLNTYDWFLILKMFKINDLKLLLSDDVLNMLYPRTLKTKYRYVRRILFE